MFTKKERRSFGENYFSVIREEERFVELMSRNTEHCWMIFKKLSQTQRPIVLYHKHTKDTQYYHKQRELWNVANAVEDIKQHDDYILKKGKETI